LRAIIFDSTYFLLYQIHVELKRIGGKSLLKKQITLLSKDLYLLLIRMVSKSTKGKNNQIVFLLSFPSTSETMLEALYEAFENQLVICYTSNSQSEAEKYRQKGVPTYCLDNFFVLCNKIIPLIKKSKVVLCDNYFAFLAGMTLDNETEVVQLWHANGAIKLFGLEAEYAKNATDKDKQRYLDVYQKFTKYVVSSDQMASIFERNYNQKINILPFGYPPTDSFFDNLWLKKVKDQFNQAFNNKKKVLLYVPTYRETSTDVPLDFAELQQNIGKDWQIFVKAHPHDKLFHECLKQETGIITDFKGMSLQEILPSVDCLITDYSSVPFEYSLANREGKMIFYCYDLHKYQTEVGIELNFERWLPGKVVQTEKELLHEIANLNPQNFEAFNLLWNNYATGKAKQQLIDWIRSKYEN